jgi:ribosomal protein S12 methylthiotransferase accessory factor YcaO
VYRVMMPKGLAAHLDASRASGEGLSEVILRLAKEAKGRTRPRAPR